MSFAKIFFQNWNEIVAKKENEILLENFGKIEMNLRPRQKMIFSQNFSKYRMNLRLRHKMNLTQKKPVELD